MEKQSESQKMKIMAFVIILILTVGMFVCIGSIRTGISAEEKDFSYIPVIDGSALIYTGEELEYLFISYSSGYDIFLFDAEEYKPKLFDPRKLNYKLMDDIDLSGKTIDALGSETYPFSGMFDGNGHTLYMKGGLIDYGDGCSVTGLTLKGEISYIVKYIVNAEKGRFKDIYLSGSLTGSPVLKADGKIVLENVNVTGTMTASGKQGGLIGECGEAEVYDCSVTLSAQADIFGGAVYRAERLKCENLTVKAEIRAAECAGIAVECGYAEINLGKAFGVRLYGEGGSFINKAEEVILHDFTLDSPLTAPGVIRTNSVTASSVEIGMDCKGYEQSAAFAVESEEAVFYGCVVKGEAEGVNVGGFVVNAGSFRAYGCKFYADLSAEGYAGGFAASANSVLVEKCAVYGSVSGRISGGICGSAVEVTVKSCFAENEGSYPALCGALTRGEITDTVVKGGKYILGNSVISGSLYLEDVTSYCSLCDEVYLRKDSEIIIKNSDFFMQKPLFGKISSDEGTVSVSDTYFNFDIEEEEEGVSPLAGQFNGENCTFSVTDNIFEGKLSAFETASVLRAGDGADGRIENNLICVFAESETAYPFTLKDDSFIIEENLYCSPEYGDIPEGNATGVYIMSLSAVYDGTPRFPDIFSSGELEVSYTLDGKEVIPVDAGTYLVTLTTGQRSFSFYFTIEKATTKVNEDFTRKYTGKAISLPMEDALFMSDGKIVTPVEAGVYEYTCTVESKNVRYMYEGTLTVEKVPLPELYKPRFEFAITSKEYDGLPFELKVINECPGIGYEIRYMSGSSYTDHVPVLPGIYRAILIMDISDSYTGAPYSDTADELVLEIRSIGVKITAGDAEYYFDETPPAFTYTVSGISKKEYAAVRNYNSVNISHKGVYPGEYELSVTGYADSLIYEFEYLSGKVTLLKGNRMPPEADSVTVGTENNTIIIQTYDPYLEFSLDGVNYEQTEYFRRLEAGKYQLYVRYAETKYYNPSEPLIIEVEVYYRFYESPWFVIVTGTVMTGVVAAICLFRSKKNKRVERKTWRRG